MTVGQLKSIISRNKPLLEECGFDSRDSFNGTLSGLRSLRNKVMHPTNILVNNRDELRKHTNCLKSVIQVLEELADEYPPNSDPQMTEDIHQRIADDPTIDFDIDDLDGD